jgi:hypothetical protein
MVGGNARVVEFWTGPEGLKEFGTRSLFHLKARTSMVDGFPYKEEVGGSNPSVPTI